MSEITDTLLKQRLRNRIIESLEAFADQNTVGILGTDEIINMWYDYVDDERLSFYDPPVFSAEEVLAIKHFHNLLEKTYEKVPSTWKVDEVKGSQEWAKLVSVARDCLVTLKKRGLLDEGNEIT